MTEHEILIVGGGLVGTAAAVALKKQGRGVALLEIRPPQTDETALHQGWDARIFAISPSNQILLQSLDAWPSEKRIQPVKKMDVRGDNGGQIEFYAADIAAERLTAIAENRWLLAALWQQICALDIPVYTDAAIALENGISSAKVKLANGETISTKLVIGADGAQSWVRAQAGIQVRELAYGHHGVVANFATEKDHGKTAFQWFKNGEVLAYLPLPDRKISIVWSTSQPEALTSMPSEKFAETVEKQGESVLGKLSQISPAFAFDLIMRCPESMFASRILLIGDAAHTIHPLAGQGVNLGFSDVAELVKLSHKVADLGAYQSLKRFAQSRLEPVRTMQYGCDGLFRLFSQNPPALPWLRNTSLNLINQSRWLKNRLIKHAVGL